MHDPHQHLIAQAGGPEGEHQTGAPATPETASETAPAKQGAGANFDRLLGELGDHREIEIGPWKIVDLPVAIIDHGFHFYPNVEEMEHVGDYKLEPKHHNIVNARTGQSPTLDMSPTSLIVFEWLAMIVMVAIFVPMASKYRKIGTKPHRGFFNAMEALVIYVRDEIVLPNTGDDGKKLMPIFLTMFFFILTMNFFGLIPGGHSATGSINVTAGLAIIAFVVIQLASIFKHGIGAWIKHLTGGVPVWLWPIMVPVEVLGLFTKPFALCVRLFANMTAGHVILISLIGLVYVGAAFIPVTLGFSLFINLLELLVAFLQAYIFTMLMAVFTGIGLASHDHEHGEDHSTAGLRDHAIAH